MIGVGIAVGIYQLFGNFLIVFKIITLLDLVPLVDLTTNWFMNWAFPNFISCFICFGLLPIILQWTCLASKGQSLEYQSFDHH